VRISEMKTVLRRDFDYRYCVGMMCNITGMNK